MSADEERPTPDPRISLRMPARISTIDSETDPFSGKSFFRTSTETCANVSRGGVFVPMRDTIPPGRRLLVELELPGGQQVQAIGRVAWTRTTVAAEMPPGRGYQSGIGVQFVGGRRDELATLERFVDRSIRRRAGGPAEQPSPFTVPEQS